MKERKLILAVRFLVLFLLIAIILPPNMHAAAVGALTIEPLTWNVIGLDSNNVSVGPNEFPVGARVCNTSATSSTVTATFNWDDGKDKFSGDPYINLRSGTLEEETFTLAPSGSPGDCQDTYYQVRVTRSSSAYDKTRRYTISATDGAVTASTPSPRELYVEYLISQNRNNISDLQYKPAGGSFQSVSAGGSFNLMVGQTYFLKLVGFTATQGYEQIESFLNLPNINFHIVSVQTTYSADTSDRVTSPDDQPYGDGCLWENNPLSPNYRSCLETGKAGGSIEVTYEVLILSGMGTSQPLNSLIYDFSGSSFHYNSDYASTARYANVVNASLSKAFSPTTISPGGTSTLTFTINNPGDLAISDVNFTDDLPSGVSIESATINYGANCGTPSPAALTVGQTALSFTNITVPSLSSCTISVTVTSAAANTYANTTGSLKIGTVDTGSVGTATLQVATAKAVLPTTCATPVEIARWSFENYTASTSTNNGPFNASWTPTDGSVASAVGSYVPGSNSSSAIVNSATIPSGFSTPTAGNTTNLWGITKGANTVTAIPMFKFAIDASNYGGLRFSTSYNLVANWSNGADYVVEFSTDNTNWSTLISTPWTSKTWATASATSTDNTAGTVYFRLSFLSPQQSTDTAYIDNVIISGCARTVADPTLSKSFSPATIAQGSTSTLTFTFTNPNASALTGVGFSDVLPAGLVIGTPNGLTTPTCSTGSISGQTITAAAGTSTITMSGATLAASSSCSFSVSVKGTTAGSYTNTSDRITSTETGPNQTSTGYGTSGLTVNPAPPVISKVFGTSTLITGNTTSLTFTIINPNTAATLTGIQFTDTLPAGVDVAASGPTAVCGGSLTTVDNAPSLDTIVLSGGSLAAGASCVFSVTVTGSTTGEKLNSVTVSSTEGGTGNTSTATVLVKDITPAISLLKKVGTSASGPWYDSTIIAPAVNVYYQFVVENTGDVPLTGISITDPTVSTTSCTWPDPLPVADALDEEHIATCVVGPVSAAAGTVTNTAYASGTYNSTAYNSDNDTANYKNGNFGHLPSAYLNMNLYNEGGAFCLNGSTYLGASVTTDATDGQVDYLPLKTTDNGVDWVGPWSAGTGYATINATCPSGTCYVYAWFDWNNDADFNDTNEAANWTVSAGNNSVSFAYPYVGNLPAGTYYARFRIYPEVPADPQPNLAAVNGSGNLLVCEIEDYRMTMSPTAVNLVEAGARPGGEMALRSWLLPLALLALIASILALGWKLRSR